MELNHLKNLLKNVEDDEQFDIDGGGARSSILGVIAAVGVGGIIIGAGIYFTCLMCGEIWDTAEDLGYTSDPLPETMYCPECGGIVVASDHNDYNPGC